MATIQRDILDMSCELRFMQKRMDTLDNMTTTAIIVSGILLSERAFVWGWRLGQWLWPRK